MAHIFGRDSLADARWLTLLRYPGLDYSERQQLIGAGWTPEQLLSASAVDLACVDWSVADDLRRALSTAKPGQRLAEIHPNHPVTLLTQADRQFPALLRACSAAPTALFCVGDSDLLGQPSVAMVGTRKPSLDGERAAHWFARDIARAGLATVSGLALGIDGVVHRATIEAGGQTIAVMATGVDSIYPRRHKDLALHIAETGLLITEFFPGTAPDRLNFPRRNRTISGLALATVVIQASRPSGSLITAASAAQQGREVFALPWSPFSSQGEGCRALLADGATLAQSPADILTVIGYSAREQFAKISDQAAADADFDTEKRQRTILDLLGDATLAIDEITAELALPAEEVQRALMALELAGVVVRSQGGYCAAH